MRGQLCRALLLLSAVAPVGCDTDKPLLVLESNIAIEMTANGARAPLYDVWSIFEDLDLDGVRDGNEPLTLWCERQVDMNGDPEDASTASVPWTYSVRARLLRDGETMAERITSAAAEQPDFNRAPYDDDGEPTTQRSTPLPFNVVHEAGQCSGSSRLCNPNSGINPCPAGQTCVAGAGMVSRRFVFVSSTRSSRTAANRDVLRSTTNGINNACFGDPDCIATVVAALNRTPVPALGVCPGEDNPAFDPEIDPGNPLSDNDNMQDGRLIPIFRLDLEKGDTLIFEAVLDSNPPLPNGFVLTELPGIRARVFVDDVLLQPDEIEGTATSPEGDPSISFSVTLQ